MRKRVSLSITYPLTHIHTYVVSDKNVGASASEKWKFPNSIFNRRAAIFIAIENKKERKRERERERERRGRGRDITSIARSRDCHCGRRDSTFAR